MKGRSVTSPTGITGIDHAVILVRDLAAAEANYKHLGFRPTPRGHHTKLDTFNHCIMLDRDYFEVLGVERPGPYNVEQQETLKEREGLWALALQTDDARAAHGRLKAAGFQPTDPVDFARPVELPGRTTEARFTVLYLEAEAVPGLRLFLCQHYTRDVVWRPDYLGQANAAKSLSHVTLAVDDPGVAADAYGRVFGVAPEPRPGGFVVTAGQARINLLAGAKAATDFAGDPVLAYRRPVPLSLGLAVSDRHAARRALESRKVPFSELAEGGLRIASPYANGVVIDLV
jgi:catechol 2,3-dioxygenase-like lactoylglutathione lyase family enzyme